MEKAIIAVGSNLGDRHKMIRKAGQFLNQLSETGPKKSSIWESEPIGGAKYTFYNAAALITTDLPPEELLKRLKEYELACGREEDHARWSPRILDLDIITYGDLVIELDNLIIPHPEYKKRLFVLYPMQEVDPGRDDVQTGALLSTLIENAPGMEIRKTELKW
jgi:2-amino-4-hydroxy-6-hydroxymethyldihydropteridine diphosphokinase